MMTHDLAAHVDTLLGKKEDQKLKSLLLRHPVQDISHVVDHLEHGKRKIFVLLPPEIQADVILLVSEYSRHFILPRLSDHAIARFLHFCNEDDAADLLHEIPQEKVEKILPFVQQEKRLRIQKLLRFEPETAGGLMDLNFIIVAGELTVKDVSDRIRDYMRVHKQAPIVVVTDAQKQIVGSIPYRTLIFSLPTKTLASLVLPLAIIPSSMDQEKVLKKATREKLDVLGVQDTAGQFIGVIHLHDLLRVAQMEATEDLLLFAGVNKEEEMLDPAWKAIGFRYHWLIINLATAFLAAFVVSLFEGTIAKTAILAAYMPIVAGMGGNAGTQTLAVVVRGIALGEAGVHKHIMWRIVSKEMIAGFVNGLINGLIVAAVIFAFKGTFEIALILLFSMIINLVVAGVFGALVPLTLKACRIDPAIAGTVFVTTATDVFGFLAFLGLATLFLH